MNERQHDFAIELLEHAAAELAQIHRGRQYALWHQDAARHLDDALAKVKPFSEFRNVFANTGDGKGVAAVPRFGKWAIDLLIAKKTPKDILAAFSAEIEKNAGNFRDVSPVFGVQIDACCDLSDGVTLTPDPEYLLPSLLRHSPFQPMLIPRGTSLLYQSFTVTPAFEAPRSDESARVHPRFTVPAESQRDAMRKRVRLACLLASDGPVELPLTVLRPGDHALFVAGEGNLTARPFTAHPLVSYPVKATAVTRAFELLGRFREADSLSRAIDRLGRARLASSPVDRALELGIAAEIALMHDHSQANTEISHKIGGRAAWLLGRDPAEREDIFVGMKKLYQARSQAAHTGTLSSRSTVDLDTADRLVARAVSVILDRGEFPNWNSLTMGGNGGHFGDSQNSAAT